MNKEREWCNSSCWSIPFVPSATTPFPCLTPKGGRVWWEFSGASRLDLGKFFWPWRICLPTVHSSPLKEGHWNDKSAWSWVIRDRLELTCQSEQGHNGVDHWGFISCWRLYFSQMAKTIVSALHALLKSYLAPMQRWNLCPLPLNLGRPMAASTNTIAEVRLYDFWG